MSLCGAASEEEAHSPHPPPPVDGQWELLQYSLNVKSRRQHSGTLVTDCLQMRPRISGAADVFMEVGSAFPIFTCPCIFMVHNGGTSSLACSLHIVGVQ